MNLFMQLKSNKIESEKVPVNWRDVESITKAARKLLLELGATVFPLKPPKKGHMGILPSAIGPQPIIQLQCGGLKVGELLWKSIFSL